MAVAQLLGTARSSRPINNAKRLETRARRVVGAVRALTGRRRACLCSFRGTLQQETFSWRFRKAADRSTGRTPGFEQALKHRGSEHRRQRHDSPHRKVNGSAASRHCTVFEISDAELKNADSYESPAYKRQRKPASGQQAWVCRRTFCPLKSHRLFYITYAAAQDSLTRFGGVMLRM